jgi:nucleotide-binding universal stress UspA family protein
MKVLFATDGSATSKKALAFLVTHQGVMGEDGKLFVLHVQAPVLPRVTRMLGAAEVKAYHLSEADKVLQPIRKFLDRHPVKYQCDWVVGSSADEIIKSCNRRGVQMIVMGTHGYGLVGRALMGSVAQRVIADCDIPVLLVK